ncbi:MAG TPA: thiopeptide-type bacteriocin biosynthesis protein [Ktedonobacteraceae bacterium]|nr:thiopeptide-type bacteriocin biosynthesis protein [Ktedonobacteraceae bacterium]
MAHLIPSPFPERANAASSPSSMQEELHLGWLYVRIYCPQVMGDDVVLGLIRPLEDALRLHGLISRFFFIRYVEGGYHLRLRLYGERQAFSKRVQPYLNDQIGRFFARRGLTLIEPGDHDPARLDDPDWQPHWPDSKARPVPSYEYDRYEPETDRYGGLEGLCISEQHFQQSSYLALHVLENERAGIGPRQNALLLLMEATAEAQGFSAQQKLASFGSQLAHWLSSPWLTPEHLRRFANEYQRYHLALSRLIPVDAPATAHPGRAVWQPIVQAWLAEIRERVRALNELERAGLLTTSLPSILVSYTHMLSNRLGIFPREEVCLLYLLYQRYADQLGVPGANPLKLRMTSTGEI